MRSKNKSCSLQVSSYWFIWTKAKVWRSGIDSTFTVAMVTKNCRINRQKIWKWPFWSKFETCKRGINTEHKQIPKNILTRPNDEIYHGLQFIKRVFYYSLVLITYSKKSDSKSLKFGLKWQFLYIRPILLTILVTIATSKSKTNAIILHLGYSPNKPIRLNWWKATFTFWL